MAFILIFSLASPAFAFSISRALITDDLEVGCGLSDLAFADFAQDLSEKSLSQFVMKSQGPETGRRLYFFSDHSWFLTLEFLSAVSTEQDITCLVAHGSGVQSDQALDFVVKTYPEWEWGAQPKNWPPTGAQSRLPLTFVF